MSFRSTGQNTYSMFTVVICEDCAYAPTTVQAFNTLSFTSL